MRRTTIIRLFLLSMAGLVGGFVLLVVAGFFAYFGDSFVLSDNNIVRYRFTGGGVTAVVLASVAAFVLVAGSVVYLVSWIAALVNAIQLPEPTWFLVVLLTGLFGVGIAGMIAYAVAAPDATRAPTGAQPPPAPPVPPAAPEQPRPAGPAGRPTPLAPH